VASLLLALAAGGVSARADAPPTPGTGGGGPGSGSSGSACAAPGMTTVPMLGDAVSLGLPLQVDGAHHVTLHDAVVCTHLADGSTEVVREALVLPAPDDQGASVSQGATCSGDPGAAMSVQCAPTAQPLVVLQKPTEGANGLGMDVSLPLSFCVASRCGGADKEVAGAAVVGLLECSRPPAQDDGTPAGGLVCLWHGAELDVDGVPFGPSAQSVAAGAWLTPHASYRIGVTAPTAGCSDPSDAASCAPPRPQDPSGWVRDNGGRILLLVLPDGDVPVVLPVAVEACVQPQGADTCPH
jgi:hypothetical protein